MSKLSFLGSTILTLVILTWTSQSSGQSPSQSTPKKGRDSLATLKVMSFNIRYGTASDGEHRWDNRKQLCASRITHFDPDILGLQEALDFQNAYILESCPGYTAVGVAREDGKKQGEYSTLLLRKTRFKLLDSGTFWLSETPEVAGSKSWDSSLPRIATWARVEDRQAENRPLLILNTHFDHRGKLAREESAQVIRSFVIKQAAGDPVILTGDFNAAPLSKPYRRLVDKGPSYGGMQDAYVEVFRNQPETDTSTSHGFGKRRSSSRIDWILHSPQWRATQATIDRFRDGPLYPSDHFAVIATLEWQ